MTPIEIDFLPNNLGRVNFSVYVSAADSKSLFEVTFKLDSGSDFTILSFDSLLQLGYTKEYLKSCPFHENVAVTASNSNLKLQYISNVSIKFGDREIQGCRVFFSYNNNLLNLFGTDILKYFNREIDYDKNLLILKERTIKPQLSENENSIHIYAIEK